MTAVAVSNAFSIASWTVFKSSDSDRKPPAPADTKVANTLLVDIPAVDVVQTVFFSAI
jgi:hypothetical protein